MSMATLDLKAPSINIRFDKGKTLKPVFYYLSPTHTVIDLAGYTARMQVRLDYTTADPAIWDLTTENTGLDIVTGTATLEDGSTVASAQGIKLNITDTQTSDVDWDRAVFDIELIEPGLDVLPFVKGTLKPYPEATR
jgi:hypothetical protein